MYWFLVPLIKSNGAVYYNLDFRIMNNFRDKSQEILGHFNGLTTDMQNRMIADLVLLLEQTGFQVNLDPSYSKQVILLYLLTCFARVHSVQQLEDD